MCFLCASSVVYASICEFAINTNCPHAVECGGDSCVGLSLHAACVQLIIILYRIFEFFWFDIYFVVSRFIDKTSE